MKKFLLYFGLFIVLIVAFVRITMGFYVVHPMGAIPEGKTVLYWRLGTDLDFIETPESYTSKHYKKYTLLTKALGIAEIGEYVNDDTIVLRLPYFEFLEQFADVRSSTEI